MNELRELRIEKKMTQQAVADLVGISLRSYISYERMLLLFLNCVISIMIREISQKPYCHRADKYDTAHLLKILLAFLPGMPENGLGSRDSVWRQFHHERKIIFLEEHAHDLGCRYRQKDA